MTYLRRAATVTVLAAAAGGLLGGTAAVAADATGPEGTVTVTAGCEQYLVQARTYYDRAADAEAAGHWILAARYRADGDIAMDRYRQCVG